MFIGTLPEVRRLARASQPASGSRGVCSVLAGPPTGMGAHSTSSPTVLASSTSRLTSSRSKLATAWP